MNAKKIIDSFKDNSGRPIEAVLAFLRGVARLKGGDELSDPYSMPTIVLDEKQEALLEAEAYSLLELPASERLCAIMELLDYLDGRDEAEFWIRGAAAEQLVDILGPAQSARFSYGSAMRPALVFAQTGDGAGASASGPVYHARIRSKLI